MKNIDGLKEELVLGFDAGSAIFTLLVVPLLSMTASRALDIVWLPRAVDASCDVDQCWPKAQLLVLSIRRDPCAA